MLAGSISNSTVASSREQEQHRVSLQWHTKSHPDLGHKSVLSTGAESVNGWPLLACLPWRAPFFGGRWWGQEWAPSSAKPTTAGEWVQTRLEREPRPRGITAHNLKTTPSLEYAAWEAGGGTRERSSHRGQVFAGVRGHSPTPWPETSAARADQQRSQQSRKSCEQGDPTGPWLCLSASDPFTPSDPLPDTRHRSRIKDKHPRVSKASSAWPVVAFQPPLKPQTAIHFSRLATLLPTKLHLCTPPRSLYLLSLFNCNSNYQPLGML